MRYLITILLSCFLLSSGEESPECNNHFQFITTQEDLPVLELDYSETPEERKKRMSELHGKDLCETCGFVDFKTPVSIEGHEGFIKIQAEFDHPHCPNCPIGLRIRNYFTILVNAQNQILAENAVVSIDSLPTSIHTYLSKVGTDIDAPDSFNRFHYALHWDSQCRASFMDSVLTIAATAHMSFVEGRMEDEGMDFCGMDRITLDSLKNAHPCQILIAVR